MKFRSLIATFSTLAILTSCGGDVESVAESVQDALNDTDNSAPSSVAGALTGTAATGAPIPNADVKVKCQSGEIKEDTTDSYGKWSIAVDDCSAPYIVKVTGSVNGRAVNLLSAADSDDVGAIVNVTPLSHIITCEVLEEADPETAFSSAVITKISKTALKAQEGRIKEKLKNVIQAVTGETDMSKVDLMNTGFSTDHKGLDAVLDMVELEIDPSQGLSLTAVDGTPILVNHDPATDTIDTTVVSVDTTKLTQIKDAYGEIDSILEGLITYVKKHPTEIAGSNSVSDLPAGFEQFYASDFKEEGLDAKGALQNWFGLDGNMDDFNSQLRDNSVSFANVKLELDPSSTDKGAIFFDFIVGGKAIEKGIDVRVKKENGSWKIHGDQSDFRFHVGINFSKRVLFDGSQTVAAQNGAELELSIDSGANLGNAVKAKISNESGVEIYTFSLEYNDYNGNGTQDSYEDSTISSGSLVSHYYGRYKLDSTAIAKFTGTMASYKVELLDSSDNVVDTKVVYLQNPAHFEDKIPSIKYTSSTTSAALFDITDLSSFCNDSDPSFSLSYPVTSDLKIMYFSANASDDAGNFNNEHLNLYDSTTSSTLSFDGSMLSGNLRFKELILDFRDKMDVGYHFSVMCHLP